MRKPKFNQKLFLFLVVCSVLIYGVFQTGNFRDDFVLAGAGDNVSGWAWSENIGWISFNNTSGGGGVNYGANIDASGIFSGYAWSENIGWISFNRAQVGAPPAAPDYGTHLAQVNLATKEASGWARACSVFLANCTGALDPNRGGWDGWIKLRGINYGVDVDTSISPYEFRNWAWADDFPVVGWISLNRANCDSNKDGFSDGSGSCPLAGTPIGDYKVVTSFLFNQPPYVQNQTINYSSYCAWPEGAGTGLIGLSWVYKDADLDNESRFDFCVNDVNNSGLCGVGDPSVEIDRSYTGLSNPDGTINNQQAVVVISPEADKIVYNSTYYWWIKVWDNGGGNSGWVAGSPVSFATPAHAYPYVNFTPSPFTPSAGEIVTFQDSSLCYNGLEESCVTEGTASYSWDFDNGEVSTRKGNTTTTYSGKGTYNVVLQITDSSLAPGGVCSKGAGVSVGVPLPEWKEVVPF